LWVSTNLGLWEWYLKSIRGYMVWDNSDPYRSRGGGRRWWSHVDFKEFGLRKLQ